MLLFQTLAGIIQLVLPVRLGLLGGSIMVLNSEFPGLVAEKVLLNKKLNMEAKGELRGWLFPLLMHGTFPETVQLTHSRLLVFVQVWF